MAPARERLFVTGDEDPFASVDVAPAADTLGGFVIPREVAERYPGRWVLLRGRDQREVVADADDLDELLLHPQRQPEDVSVFIRDPAVTYQ